MKSPSDIAVVGEGIGVRRGGRMVLTDLSFSVAGGEALVVTGPNGSGKSTLLRAVAGLIATETGTISFVGGLDRGAVHLVAHRNAIKQQTTVYENALFFARWQGGAGDAEARAEAALVQVGLEREADAPAAFLSQGQGRRLALARLLAAPRPVWLLDEPVAGLDAASRGMFASAMGEHLEGGGLILVSTHEPLGLSAPRELAL